MIQKLAAQALEYIAFLPGIPTLLGLAALGLVIGLAIKLTKYIGIVPLFGGLAIIGGAVYLGSRLATVKPQVVEKTVERIVEIPVGSDYAIELWEKSRTAQKEKEMLAEKLKKAEGTIARLDVPKGSTQVREYSPGDSVKAGDTVGYCVHCMHMLILRGEKGSAVIRCPYCGGKMPALAAIQYQLYVQSHGTLGKLPTNPRRR